MAEKAPKIKDVIKVVRGPDGRDIEICVPEKTIYPRELFVFAVEQILKDQSITSQAITRMFFGNKYTNKERLALENFRRKYYCLQEVSGKERTSNSIGSTGIKGSLRTSAQRTNAKKQNWIGNLTK